MRGMRNRMAHGYFDIDLGIVWQMVQSSLPALAERLTAIGLQTVRGRRSPIMPGQSATLYLLETYMEPNLISRDLEIMSGALCFTGTRVPVQNLFDCLEGNSSLEDFLEDFPSVPREAAVAVLEAARERLFADATPA